MWKKLAKLLIAVLCLAAIFGSSGYLTFWYYFDYKVDDLPDVISLKNYNFNLSTVVRDDKGEVINTFAVEDRIYIPFKNIPDVVIKSVVAAEDKNFWNKRLIAGLDLSGIARAAGDNVLAITNESWRATKAAKKPKIKFKTVGGGSTITQQVAKKIWLSDEKTLKRKWEEARLAYRMEKSLPKELIFELYINLAYFGRGKYGIYTASEFYFGKSPDRLTVGEAAMLAGIIKWPHRFSPAENQKAAQNRRNTILERMHSNGFVGAEELKNLKSRPLVLNIKSAEVKAPYLPVMEELHQFGYEKIVNQGLDVRLSLNSDFQQIAETALQKGLAAYGARHEKRLVLYNIFSDYKMKSLGDFQSKSWDGEIGLGSAADGLIVEVAPLYAVAKISREKAVIDAKSFSKIRRDIDDFAKAFKIGDVVSLRITGVDAPGNFSAEIIQPKAQGAVIILDIKTGGIKAIVGGRDFEVNQYNRAMQAERQAGSAFKPFVYGAYFERYPERNLESIVKDTKICFKTGNPEEPLWCPKNYEEKTLPAFMGPIPIKTAIARSRNVAAIHATCDMGIIDKENERENKEKESKLKACNRGINKIIDLAESLEITSEIPRYLPTAIGAADVKVVDMACAFAAFFRNGVYKPCWFLESVADKKQGFRNFTPVEEKQALSAEAANKVLEGMRWVVLAGTARSAAKELLFPIAGKTGTTNNFTDVWFIGGTPRYVVTSWIGFDRKAIPLVSRDAPERETGGFTAAPIAVEILKGIYKNGIYDSFPEEMEARIKGEPTPKKEETKNPD